MSQSQMPRRRSPWVLGISFSHNGAACLLHGDEIVVAVQEERLTRRKRARLDPGQPSLAINYCLDYAGITPRQLDTIAVTSQPPRATIAGSAVLEEQLGATANATHVVTLSHHAAHALSAFAMSGFEDAAVLVVDGMGSPAQDFSEGERAAVLGPCDGAWECISLYTCEGATLTALEKHVVPRGEWLLKRTRGMPLFRSLGGLYAAAAQQIFGDETEAGHVMGLAPFGKAVIPVSDVFDICDGRFIYKDAVPESFAHDRRWPDDAARYADLAASVQAALEQAILALAAKLARASASRNLCYAGGVALNVTANERLHRESAFKNIFIPAAAEDSGPAIGAAFWGLWSLTGRHAPARVHRDSFGRRYGPTELSRAVRAVPGLRQARPEDLLEECARRLSEGQIAGWFHGGSELGPRALGHRSILADPRDPRTKDRLNSKVKFRAPFRPFAPAILKEYAGDWFDLADAGDESAFMLRVWNVKDALRAKVPAICHVDGTGRAQTVDKAWSPRFHALIEAFRARTGVPVLVNTSFNVNKEPIVETPEDALWCFLMTDIDFCVLEDRIVTKDGGRAVLANHYPKIAARELRVPARATGVIDCVVRTPWGDRPLQLAGAVTPLLRLIDGRRSIGELGELLRRESPDAASETAFVALLVYLRRAAVLAFSPTPW